MGIRNVFIFKGEGVAICDAKKVPIKARDILLVPPTGTHLIRNTGNNRLYKLTIMVPNMVLNEYFSELVCSGIPLELDAEDMSVLGRLDYFSFV
jgi:hypothetical protein